MCVLDSRQGFDQVQRCGFVPPVFGLQVVNAPNLPRLTCWNHGGDRVSRKTHVAGISEIGGVIDVLLNEWIGNIAQLKIRSVPMQDLAIKDVIPT